MQEFDRLYEAWMKKQLKHSSPLRRKRLLNHGHAEKALLRDVLWPALRSFEYLHAEYEVSDFRDGVRFLDYAYLRPPRLVDIEADGHGPHARHADQQKFSDDLMRQNHLILDEWAVIRFAYPDIRDNPRMCQQIILQMLGKFYGGPEQFRLGLPLKQREILRYAAYAPHPIKPSEVSALLGVGLRQARMLLKQLVDEGHLEPAGGTERIRSYRIFAHKRKGVQ